MRQYLDCDVNYDDTVVLESFRGGRITVNGKDATIWRRASDNSRFEQVDRMTDVSVIDEKKGNFTITGRSRQLAANQNLHGDDAVLKVKVHARGGCPTC